jgi:hypothetical protein
MRTISTFVLSGALVSSGAEKSRTSKPAIELLLGSWTNPGDDPKPVLAPVPSRATRFKSFERF